ANTSNQKPGESGPGEGVNVETAHAVSTGPGRYVTLSSDTEELVVSDANEFFYDALKQLTTIKAAAGKVKVLYKSDTKIHAPELEIQDVKPAPPPGWKQGMPLPPAARPYQKVKAKGPGWIVMVDKPEVDAATGKAEKRPLRAEWTELLTSDR